MMYVTNTTDEVEESLGLVKEICLAAQKEAPDYDYDKIYEILYGEKSVTC